MDKAFTALMTLMATGTTYAGLSMTYQDVGYLWLAMVFIGGFITALLLMHILKAE
jgi:hypothetical protein